MNGNWAVCSVSLAAAAAAAALGLLCSSFVFFVGHSVLLVHQLWEKRQREHLACCATAAAAAADPPPHLTQPPPCLHRAVCHCRFFQARRITSAKANRASRLQVLPSNWFYSPPAALLSPPQSPQSKALTKQAP